MDYFVPKEASEILKVALSSGIIKLLGTADTAEASEAAAKNDAIYLRAFYGALAGPGGGASVAAESPQAEAPKAEGVQQAPDPKQAEEPTAAASQVPAAQPPGSQHPSQGGGKDYQKYIPESARKYMSGSQ